MDWRYAVLFTTIMVDVNFLTSISTQRGTWQQHVSVQDMLFEGILSFHMEGGKMGMQAAPVMDG